LTVVAHVIARPHRWHSVVALTAGWQRR